MDDDHTTVPVNPRISNAAGSSVASRSHSTGGSRARAQPDVLAVIALGGMLGATARYGVTQLLPSSEGRFPWATFVENLTGSFLLGLLLMLLLERFPPTRYVRPFLATGILGAFTTMSTYQLENTLLLKDGPRPTAVVYALGSLAAGLALAYAGIRAGRLNPVRRREVSR